jgi:hypothetical protein
MSLPIIGAVLTGLGAFLGGIVVSAIVVLRSVSYNSQSRVS